MAPGGAATARMGQRAAPRPYRARSSRHSRGRRLGGGLLRDGHAGPGRTGARGGLGRAGRGRRGGRLCHHAMAARGQGADRACLGLPEDKVRLHLAGVGGAFGSREDIHMQVHACVLALRTGRPVKFSYGREESFYGHVHRHPSRIWMRHGATRDGRLVTVDARLLFDGGAYASSSPAVVGNAATFAAGPTRCPMCASRAPSSTPTTLRAAPCAASELPRCASPTRRRWTSWPRRSVPTRSSCAFATLCPGARSCRPARSCGAAPR